MSIASYQDLDLWEPAIDVTEDRHKLTAAFPCDERFGRSARIKRAGASIPADIAEGYGREQTGGHVRILRIAQGSLRKLETHHVSQSVSNGQTWSGSANHARKQIAWKVCYAP